MAQSLRYPVRSHTHAHTHTLSHTRTHAHTRTLTHARTLTRTHTQDRTGPASGTGRSAAAGRFQRSARRARSPPHRRSRSPPPPSSCTAESTATRRRGPSPPPPCCRSCTHAHVPQRAPAPPCLRALRGAPSRAQHSRHWATPAGSSRSAQGRLSGNGCVGKGREGNDYVGIDRPPRLSIARSASRDRTGPRRAARAEDSAARRRLPKRLAAA